MELVTKKKLRLYSGRAHPALASDIAEHLGVALGETNLREFANGELHCRFGESLRGADVFIIQSHGGEVNKAIMEHLIMIDAAKRASAKRITAVCPYYGYARQDRKAEGREPITAKLVADMFRAAGAHRVVSVDLHSGQIQGFFDGPVDHLTAMPVLVDYLKEQDLGSFVVVSPDAGRVKVAERFSQHVGADLAFVNKYRPKGTANTVLARDVIGDVDGRHHLRSCRHPARARCIRRVGHGHARGALRPRHRPAQELRHLPGGGHRHAADHAREADRQARGAVGRRPGQRRHRRGVRGHQRERDLRRREPELTFITRSSPVGLRPKLRP